MLAVLLSIRHDSLFIAVLGLLGGFATPALLSTGENQPIPLFMYLLLLNAGLAWVAFKKGWPILTILTLILTTIYQWGWVVTFLDTNQLTLAMGIFLVFSVTSFAALILGRRASSAATPATRPASARANRRGGGADAAPVCHLPGLGPATRRGPGAAVRLPAPDRCGSARHRRRPARGADARDRRWTTLLVFAIWLGRYPSGALTMATLFTAIFVLLYTVAPMLAERLKKPFEGVAATRHLCRADAAVRVPGDCAD